MSLKVVIVADHFWNNEPYRSNVYAAVDQFQHRFYGVNKLTLKLKQEINTDYYQNEIEIDERSNKISVSICIKRFRKGSLFTLPPSPEQANQTLKTWLDKAYNEYQLKTKR